MSRSIGRPPPRGHAASPARSPSRKQQSPLPLADGTLTYERQQRLAQAVRQQQSEGSADDWHEFFQTLDRTQLERSLYDIRLERSVGAMLPRLPAQTRWARAGVRATFYLAFTPVFIPAVLGVAVACKASSVFDAARLTRQAEGASRVRRERLQGDAFARAGIVTEVEQSVRILRALTELGVLNALPFHALQDSELIDSQFFAAELNSTAALYQTRLTPAQAHEVQFYLQQTRQLMAEASVGRTPDGVPSLALTAKGERLDYLHHTRCLPTRSESRLWMNELVRARVLTPNWLPRSAAAFDVALADRLVRASPCLAAQRSNHEADGDDPNEVNRAVFKAVQAALFGPLPEYTPPYTPPAATL